MTADRPTALARSPARWNGIVMLLPAGIFLLVLFAYPLADVLRRGVYQNGFTLEFFRRIVGDPVYWAVFQNTIEIAGLVTLACLLVGYPLAYFMNGRSAHVRSVLLMFILFPLFTSVVVRAFAWMALLGRNGVVNQYLVWLKMTETPLRLLYTKHAVVVGITYVLLPIMVLTLFSTMRGIDSNLIRAAHSLGAGRAYTFTRIFLPLSLSGVAAGILLVFIMALGYFITPALMGGPSDVMIAMLIQRQIEVTNDWPFASALAIALLALTTAGFILCNRFVRLDRVFAVKA